MTKSGLKVLVADDDDDVREVTKRHLEKILKDRSVTIYAVDSIPKLRERLKEGMYTPYTLIVADVHMGEEDPEGNRELRSYEVCRDYLGVGYTTPVIFMTGDPGQKVERGIPLNQAIQESFPDGKTTLLEKPYGNKLREQVLASLETTPHRKSA